MKKNIKHIPFNKARSSVPRECLYLKEWQEFAEKVSFNNDIRDVTNFEHIFNLYGNITPGFREALVAASFVTFMGSNVGRAFTLSSEDLYRRCDGILTREDAFLSCWMKENKRISFCNNGMILMEAIVGRYVNKSNSLNPYESAYKLDKFTVEDWEALNVMVIWWSTEEAKEMRERCESYAVKQTNEILASLYS